ncbi:MAG: hypothetical protein WBA54_11935, partial [Acidaminobacteraceae bacterium]
IENNTISNISIGNFNNKKSNIINIITSVLTNNMLNELNIFDDKLSESIRNSVFNKFHKKIDSRNVFAKVKSSDSFLTKKYTYDLIGGKLSYNLKEENEDSLEHMMLLEEIYNQKRSVLNLNKRLLENFNYIKERSTSESKNIFEKSTNISNTYIDEHNKLVQNLSSSSSISQKSTINENYINNKIIILEKSINKTFKNFVKQNLISGISDIDSNMDLKNDVSKINEKVNLLKQTIDNNIRNTIEIAILTSKRVDKNTLNKTDIENHFIDGGSNYKKLLESSRLLTLEVDKSSNLYITNLETDILDKSSFVKTIIDNISKSGGPNPNFVSKELNFVSDFKNIEFENIVKNLTSINLHSQLIKDLSLDMSREKYNSIVSFYNYVKYNSKYNSENDHKKNFDVFKYSVVSGNNFLTLSNRSIQSKSEKSFHNILTLLNDIDEISFINNLVKLESITDTINEYTGAYKAYNPSFINLFSSLNYAKNTNEDIVDGSKNTLDNLSEIRKLSEIRLETHIENYRQVYNRIQVREGEILRKNEKLKERNNQESKNQDLYLIYKNNSYDMSQNISNNNEAIREYKNVFNTRQKKLALKEDKIQIMSQNIQPTHNSYILNKLVNKFKVNDLKVNNLSTYLKSQFETNMITNNKKNLNKNIFESNFISNANNSEYISVFNNLVQNLESDVSNYSTKKYELFKNMKNKVVNKIISSDYLYKEIYKSVLDYNLVENVKATHISKSDKASTLNQSMNMNYITTSKNEDHISIKAFEKVSKEVVVLKEKIKDMEAKNSIKKKTPKSKSTIFDSLSDKERLERQRRGDF